LSNYLHIVCLDAPSPPNYGGAIDIFYKVKALAESGKKIILHYFNYNPSRNAKGLEAYCESIHTYTRKTFFQSVPIFSPHIVASRTNSELIKRINNDLYPVLLEGLHCSGIAPFIESPQRIVLRMHNNEAAYYHYLARNERNFFKRNYFLRESRLLSKYSQSLDKSNKLACLSEADIESFQKEGFQRAAFIPCFIPWQKLAIQEGRGDYCLYHGNMSVSENEEAAIWLIKQVFSKTNAPLLIAGKGISRRVERAAAQYKNVSLKNNPGISEIDSLIRNAHINVLPSMNNTGVKLKLLNALLNGRHCITNLKGIKGSGIDSSVIIADNVQEWTTNIEAAMQESFSAQQIESRRSILDLYDNRKNAERLNALW
jgi:hypothetical protein